MIVFIISSILFLSSVILHFFICRVIKPKNCTVFFIKISLVFLVFSFIFLLYVFNVWQIFYFCLFFISLMFAYAITFSAVEADSPSFTIVMAISSAGKEGLFKYKLNEIVTDQHLVIPRINDLLRDKLIFKEKQKFILSSKGRSFVSIWVTSRKVLGLGKGG